MNLSIFVFFICCAGSSSTKYNAQTKRNGYDQRPLAESSPLLAHLIPQFFQKKRLLNVLENLKIPLHVKTRLLAEPSTNIRPPNIYAGGLMKSWAFDMDEPKSGQ